MFNRTLTPLLAAAIAAGAVATAAPARAAAAEEMITVSLAGLDLSDPANADRIDRRIRNAARGACRSDLLQPIRLMVLADSCEKSFIADARSTVEVAAARQSGPLRLALRSN